jgi:hypothetical protein
LTLFGDLKVSKARVTLTGCATYSVRGEFWKKRETKTISDPELIAFYRSRPEFEVKAEPVKAEPVKAEPEPEPVKAEPVKAEPEPEPVKAEPVKAEPVKAEPVKAEPVKAKANPKKGAPQYKQYTADQLRKETKASLAVIAKVQYKLKLNPEKPKELLVGQVLAAQRFAFEKANKEA